MGRAQLSLDLPASIPASAYEYGERTSGETHGVVLTKPHVVGLILDLAGYFPERDLGRLALLEPSCGHGAFLVQVVDRLMRSAKHFGHSYRELGDALTAFDIDTKHVQQSRSAVVEVLRAHRVRQPDATRLAERWIRCGDFLLASKQRPFDFVVGNPPYVRIEQLSSPLQAEYRRRYGSLYDRADLYVAFIERGLDLLSEQGVLVFICADRWILNRYGAPLRELVADRFSVRCYIDLHHASPFDSEVIAYPSVFAISRDRQGPVKVGALESASPEECRTLVEMILQDRTGSAAGVSLAVFDSWFDGSEPWVISSPQHLAMLRHLESKFALLASTGVKVGIGVATGNDRVFIVSGDVDIEPDRLVPLVMREDMDLGRIRDAKRFVINTFSADGGTVDLADYPRLRRYLQSHEVLVRKRHVAQKNPGSWFRTIDRVYPELVSVPKLLIPDIAGSNEVVFDAGRYYPHHNLYFVTTSSWDLEVLGGLLSSRLALFFVWSYAVKMRGGYLRFQAQYLRRIRVPSPQSIEASLAHSIRTAFRERDFPKLDALAQLAYGLEDLPSFDFVDTRK